MTNNTRNEWGSQKTYIMVVLCQVISTPIFINLPNIAVLHGATGYMICYVLGYFVFGIPLLYMEFIIGQFTARDCVDAWKVRSCLSHIGYIVVIWQILTVINNHITVSFTFHYLLISFENPVPYYTCGNWSMKNCGILKVNYTINEDCIRLKYAPHYCEDLFKTYPEYQYWKYNMLGHKKMQYSIAWRVCLASALICVVIYLNCFKRKTSVRLVVMFYTVFPILGYIMILLASMLQKGVIVLYQDALDTDFQQFLEHFRLSMILMQVVIHLGLGSGLTFNLSLGVSFRAPCYSNTVTVVMVCAATATLAVCTTAMMTCPYAFENGIQPSKIIGTSISLIYEKIPRLLNKYQSGNFWVILALSCITILSMSTNIIIIHHLIDMAEARYTKIAKYPGLTTFLIAVMLYIITIPLLSGVGVVTMLGLRRFFGFVSTFVTLVETVVFILWYGLDKFAEDVHFMQGIQPRTWMKLAWVCSSVILLYVFTYETYAKSLEFNGSLSEIIGWTFFLVTIFLIVSILLLKLAIAGYKHEFAEVISLDRTWGPRDELLQRSRAMFTAQAMTKEYLYRQYHLQAGILSRQRMSNCRNT